MHSEPDQKPLLSEWLTDMPRDCIEWVNAPITSKELARLKLSLERGRPFGSDR